VILKADRRPAAPALRPGVDLGTVT
jgi:hypothetical protein